MASKEEILAALEELGAPYVANEEVVPTGERKCPICQGCMRVELHGGVSVDVCAGHGVWLDNGELMAMLSRTDAPSQYRMAQAIAKARREGKISGILLGAWSLLGE